MRFSLSLLSVLPLCISLGASPITSSSFTNAATLVDFDDLTGGNGNLWGPSVTNQYANLGVTFSNPSYPGEETADTNLAPLMPASGPNALYVYQGGMIGNPSAQPLQITFSTPVTMMGFDFGSSVDSFLELDIYSSSNTLIETLDFTGSPAPIGLAGFAGVQESTPIAQVDVSYHLDSDPSRTLNFSIANVEFQGNPVPEPSTVALMGMGFLGIALGRRRARRHRSRPSPAA